MPNASLSFEVVGESVESVKTLFMVTVDEGYFVCNPCEGKS